MISTRWLVITGAPCCGKTTVLQELERLGFKCAYEAARLIIDAQLAKGLTLLELHQDELSFQRSVVDAKSLVEQQLDAQEIVFLDRAMPDSISYFKLKGLDPTPILPLSKKFRYERVFLFDRLPLEQDGARIEDEQSASFLDKHLELDYRSLGYEVVRVPVMSIEERVATLLSYVEQS